MDQDLQGGIYTSVVRNGGSLEDALRLLRKKDSCNAGVFLRRRSSESGKEADT